MNDLYRLNFLWSDAKRCRGTAHTAFVSVAVLVLSLICCSQKAYAIGTAAGTVINNTATATYEDPNNAGTTINASSNTVTVTVAKIAGITATFVGVTNATTGSTNYLPGNVLDFDYQVTNIGNDPSSFYVPGTVTVTGQGTAGTVLISTDNGATFPTSVVANGQLTSTTISANSSIVVRVPVTVNQMAVPGATIAVLLGDTPPNDNSASTQNQAYSGDGLTPAKDLYTSDTSTPANGEREASCTDSITIGSMPTAFALVLLTHGTATIGATTQQDLLPYNISFRVLSSAPSGALPEYVPADLTPTTISVDGSSVTRVLISTAIPANTVLNSVSAGASGWTIVYTTTATSTNANSAAWTSTAPSPLSTTTRIGFVLSTNVTKGTTISGMTFTVLTSGANLASTTQINAYSQSFGLSNGDATNTLDYDESGDQDPDNFNDDGSFYNSIVRNGVANPANDGTDASNNNSGTGAGGQDNIYTVVPPGTIGNGPDGHPTATGPTNGNDDFTNESVTVPAGVLPGGSGLPSSLSMSYVNTIQNTGSSTITNTIYIVPISPAVLTGESIASLPNNTTVRFSYGGNSPLYTYDSGTGTWTLSSGTHISTVNLAAGASINYNVTITLPSGTSLSTDSLKGYPVVIQAFIDRNGNGILDTGEIYDDTVDRVYAGFVKVSTAERIIDTDGVTAIEPNDGSFATSLTTSNMRPGRFIEYQITYQNISSTAGSGTGDILLNADNISIIADGTTGGSGANWALDNDGNGSLDTSHVIGHAVDSGAATINYYNGNPPSLGTEKSGTTAATDTTKYIDAVTGTLAPTSSRTFTFRRKLN